MKDTNLFKIGYLWCLTCLLSGCADVSTNQAIDNTQYQLQTRNYQARKFDTADRRLVMRAVIATLQDLGFMIENANESLGMITGESYRDAPIVLTVSVRHSTDQKQVIVRVNARNGLSEINKLEVYQNFFASLDKSLFLAAHNVD